MLRLFIFLSIGLSLLAGIILSIRFYRTEPSHTRQWELGQEQLPLFSIENHTLQVDNFRNFLWTGPLSAEARYETRFFDLNQVNDLDVFISHFDTFEGLAHIFLSFGFTDGQHLIISLESRRERGETFSPFRGLWRQYELLYVVGSEEDLVGSRLTVRNERVYRYDTIASPQETRALLLKLGESINEIAAHPRFYNTLTRNCTNEITRQVESVTAVDFPTSIKTFLPGYFDEVLYSMGLLETRDTFYETKRQAKIHQLVDPTDPNFSQKLREK